MPYIRTEKKQAVREPDIQRDRQTATYTDGIHKYIQTDRHIGSPAAKQRRPYIPTY